MLTGPIYDEATTKAYEFIKRMLDPSEWEVRPYYGEEYAEDYRGKLMWGGASDIPDSALRTDPNYIRPDQYYYPGYNGVISGTWQLPPGENPKNYAVAVYRISSSSRSIECYCPLLTDEDDEGGIHHIWSSGKLVEAWEYYLSSFDRSRPYMSDGQGGYIPWASTTSNPSPTRYYRTEFSSSKLAYWYWAKSNAGSSSTYAYEIELVRKDWTVPITEEMRQNYLNRPTPRPDYVRTDYAGLLEKESFNLFDLMEMETVRDPLFSSESGWIGRDDKVLPVPDYPEFTTGMPTEIQSQSFSFPEPVERDRGFIEHGYSRFMDYKIYLFALVLGDAEYLNGEAPLWSDQIYPLPSNPPPIPVLVEEITNITVLLGATALQKNFTFLSTIDSNNAAISISGTVTPAANEGYISFKTSHATYKGVAGTPASPWDYSLSVGDIATPSVSMPPSGSVFRFIAAGDPQITNEASGAAWEKSITQAFSLYPDAQFIATMGDNVDEQVDMSLAMLQFDMFLAPLEMHTRPLFVAMGNHDDNMGFDGHFNAPNESKYGVVGGQGDYWSLYGDTLLLCLNTNVKGDKIHEHIAFVNEVVQQNRDVPWKMVTFHHSIFQPTNTAEEQQYVDLRNHFVPCFSRNNIDVVLMGHVHSYCRTFLIDGSDLSAGDTVTTAAVVPGSGGSAFTKKTGETLYVTLNSASGSKFYPLSGQHWYAAKAEQELIPHISCVEVNGSAVTVTTHRTSNMSIVDQFTLNKER